MAAAVDPDPGLTNSTPPLHATTFLTNAPLLALIRRYLTSSECSTMLPPSLATVERHARFTSTSECASTETSAARRLSRLSSPLPMAPVVPLAVGGDAFVIGGATAGAGDAPIAGDTWPSGLNWLPPLAWNMLVCMPSIIVRNCWPAGEESASSATLTMRDGTLAAPPVRNRTTSLEKWLQLLVSRL